MNETVERSGRMTGIIGKPSFLQYRSLIWNFGQRDLKSRFKGTAMGWAWSLMVPLASLGMYSVVFGVIFRAQAPDFGNGRQAIFAVWLFVGLVAWNFFSNCINTAMNSLVAVGGLLKKIYFPAYAPVIGAMIAVGFQSLIEMTLLLVTLALLGNLSWTFLLLPLWIAAFFGFVVGLALVCAVANIYFRDLAHLIGVVLQLLFYAAPIMYPPSAIPSSFHGIDLRRIIEANPISKFVELFRNLIYDLQPGTVHQWLVIAILSLGSLAAGLIVVARYGKDIGEQI